MEGAETNQKESNLLVWSAPEFHSYEHNWTWYLLVLIASLAVIGYSIYSRDWIIIGVVIVLDVFIYLYANKKPGETEYRITQLGIYAGQHFYSYNEIHSFWISYHKQKRLSVIFNKRYLPQLSIIIDTLDPFTLKTTLGKYIPEQEKPGRIVSWYSISFIEDLSNILYNT